MSVKYLDRSRKGNMSELPIALLMLMILLAFPLINLLGLVTGTSIACLIAHQAASRAASHQTYDSALTAMENEASNLINTGFANFAHMNPIRGYSGTGADLYVVASNYRTGGTKTFGPNEAVQDVIDPSSWLYECNVRVKYEIGPVISMASAPFIGEIPGLGKPVVITFEASRSAEYPTGLNKIGDLANDKNSQGQPVASLSIPWDAAMSPAGSSWNNPTLYQIAESQGLRCVDDDVIVVPANSAEWTKTHFKTIGRIFIDVRSDGSWSVAGNGGAIVSADGYSAQRGGNQLPIGALIGKIGASGQPFLLGQSQFGFVPPNGGNDTLYLAMNAGNGPINAATDPIDPDTAEAYAKSTGAQIVRVISAR
ncbi:hypothetical protein BH10CYA1_BH10CYA1_05170 [soil metagenome]